MTVYLNVCRALSIGGVQFKAHFSGAHEALIEKIN